VLGGVPEKEPQIIIIWLCFRGFYSEFTTIFQPTLNPLSHGPLKYLTCHTSRGLIGPSKKDDIFAVQRQFHRQYVRRTPLLHAYLKPLMSKFFVVRKEPSLEVQMNREFPKMKKQILTYQRAHLKGRLTSCIGNLMDRYRP
jgi:hypothetical protein